MRIKALALTVATLLSAYNPLSVTAAGVRYDDQLIQAARAGDMMRLRALLDNAANVNATQPDGATALHWAAHRGDVAMAAALLRAGADVNHANAYGATPLWLACVNGNSTIVQLFLDHGADPNLALPSGETPLHTAARGGTVETVRALVARGAKANARESEQGQTPLEWAAAEGRVEVMRALVSGGARVNDTSDSGFTPLMFVARQGSVDAARVLLDGGATVNAQSATGATALLTAVVRGHVDLAEFLLDRGADPNVISTGYTALHWAAGTWESAFTKEYHDWEAAGGLPTFEAKAAVIKALVAHGADVNARMKNDAPRTGFTLIVSHAPSILRKAGATPFFVAAQSGDARVMRLLLELGADPNTRSGNNATPAMVAAGRLRLDYESRIQEQDALAATKLAIESGNDVNAANDDGETALHAAVMAGYGTVIDYLVARGATLDVRTSKGRTAVDIAENGYTFSGGMQIVKRPGIAAQLRQLGAKE